MSLALHTAGEYPSLALCNNSASAAGIGVESTARDACAHGGHVALATDAMADGAPEAHDGRVRRLFPRPGEAGTTAENLALLERTHA